MKTTGAAGTRPVGRTRVFVRSRKAKRRPLDVALVLLRIRGVLVQRFSFFNLGFKLFIGNGRF
jgi:hypothetical protein